MLDLEAWWKHHLDLFGRAGFPVYHASGVRRWKDVVHCGPTREECFSDYCRLRADDQPIQTTSRRLIPQARAITTSGRAITISGRTQRLWSQSGINPRSFVIPHIRCRSGSPAAGLRKADGRISESGLRGTITLRWKMKWKQFGAWDSSRTCTS